MKRLPAWRVRVPQETVTYEDGGVGQVTQDLARDVGDFVLRRGDGAFAYQLAVVVDDLDMGITDVVRGADLVGSTPRQIWLMQTLGACAPRFVHVPLVLAADGGRLEKRAGGLTVRELREGGVRAERVIGELAFGLGLAPAPNPTTAAELSGRSLGRPFTPPREAWRVPESLVLR